MNDLEDFIKFVKKNNLNKFISTNDIDSYIKNPENNWIYNKLELSKRQNLSSAPWPIIPSKYPIIIKPMINLYGMSRGFEKINNMNQYLSLENKDGYFWQKYLSGKQINLDIIVDNGKIIDYFAIYSKDNKDGTFEYHKLLKEYKISEKIILFIQNNLSKYKGLLNFETIDNYIIEAHLRFNCDFFIYNEKFCKNLISFFFENKYNKIKIKDITYFPIFIDLGTLNKLNINVITEKINKIIDKYKKFIKYYKFKDINSLCQSFNKKRIFVFTTNYHKIGLTIKHEIYNKINLN
jgi:hypothetical protein